MLKSCLKMSSEDSIMFAMVSLKRSQRTQFKITIVSQIKKKASTKLGAKIIMIVHVIWISVDKKWTFIIKLDTNSNLQFYTFTNLEA